MPRHLFKGQGPDITAKPILSHCRVLADSHAMATDVRHVLPASDTASPTAKPCSLLGNLRCCILLWGWARLLTALATMTQSSIISIQRNLACGCAKSRKSTHTTVIGPVISAVSRGTFVLSRIGTLHLIEEMFAAAVLRIRSDGTGGKLLHGRTQDVPEDAIFHQTLVQGWWCRAVTDAFQISS